MRSFCRHFERRFHYLFCDTLIQRHSQVNHRNIRRGDTHRLPIESAGKIGQYFRDRFCSTGGCRYKVGRSGTPFARIFFMFCIKNRLGRGIGVDSRHKAMFNAKRIIENLGDRRQTVCSTGCIGNHRLSCIRIGICANYKCRGIIFCRCREKYLFDAVVKIRLHTLLCQEGTGTFQNQFGTIICKIEFGRVSLGKNFRFVVADTKVTVTDPNIFAGTVYRVIFNVIFDHLFFAAGIDCNQFYIVSVGNDACNTSSDPSQSVYRYFYCHHCPSITLVV